MPIVQVELLEGRTVEQKRNMVREVTDAICKTLEVAPEAVRIIIRDMPKENFGVAGALRADQK